MNTSDETVSLNSLKIKLENLDNYQLYNVENRKHDRSKNVLEKLSKNFPNQFKETVTCLCSDYSDIFGYGDRDSKFQISSETSSILSSPFGLETEKISTIRWKN